MDTAGADPSSAILQAQRTVEGAAADLRRTVRELATALRPFPPFPGAFFTAAVEVEPDAAGDPERGCVVVCADGELYELVVGVSFESPEAILDPVAARKEELRPLDLHPRDYIVYAYNAVTALADELLQRGGSA
jgi:hypothetical protein